MAGLVSTSSPSSHLLLQRFLRPPSKPPSASSSLLSLVLSKTHLAVRHSAPPIQTNTSNSTSPLLSSSHHRPPLYLPIRCLSTPELTTEDYTEDEYDGDVGFESVSDDSESDNVESDDSDTDDAEEGAEIEQPPEEIPTSSPAKAVESSANKLPLPNLSIKEKKELASYAHSLGKELRSQQIGKSGVTEAVATALVETLEKRELLKIKIHNNSPGELADEVKLLEKLTGSVAVSQIGRTVILYRPSLAKLKAEEKKKQNEIIVAKRRMAFKSQFQNRGQSRSTGSADRGGSGFSSSRGGSGSRFSSSRGGSSSRFSSSRGDSRSSGRDSGSSSSRGDR